MKFYYHNQAAVIIKVSGRDASNYLQSRTTNNVKKLDINDSCLSACVSAQGKVESVQSIVRLDVNEYVVLYEKGNINELVPLLGKYKVADDVSFQQLDGYSAIYISEKAEVEDSFSLKFSLYHSNGCYLVFKSENIDLILNDLNKFNYSKIESEKSFTLERLNNGKFSWPEDINESTLLPEARVDEITSFTKGCYVGQEVLERVDSYGKLPKLMYVALTEELVSESSMGVNIYFSNSDLCEQIGKIQNEYRFKDHNKVYLIINIKNKEEYLNSNYIYCGVDSPQYKLKVIW